MNFSTNKFLIFFIFASFFLLSNKSITKKPAASEPETVLRLSPSENNPRNSEGDFITLNDGRILFIYSHYTGDSSSDHAPAHLAGRISEDGGKTWSFQDEIILRNWIRVGLIKNESKEN